MERDVVARALAAPELRRWEQQVLMVCRKLGIPAPQWATERKPPAGEPFRGS
jgi:hypothetical protein